MLPDIRSLIPHAESMALLDRVLAADEKSLSAEVTIQPNSLFCGPNGVGAWVGIEYMAQAIAAYAGYQANLRGESVKMGFLLGTRQYESYCTFFSPMTTLQIKVQHILQTDNGLGSFECAIYNQQTELAKATITVFQPEDVTKFLASQAK